MRGMWVNLANSWWDRAIEKASVGSELLTPGRGVSGLGGKPFRITAVDSRRIVVESGRSSVPLDRKCFDVLQNVFYATPGLWLRVASSHGEPFEGSADAVIREHTGSDLARANYICSILVHSQLVEYSMHGNQKGIRLPADGQPFTHREFIREGHS